MSKQYAERDAMALDEAGGYYMRHVMAMTGEKLHGKGDIAAELGWRDMQIAALQQKLDAMADFRTMIFSTLGVHDSNENFVARVNIENALRRSACLSAIERHFTIEVADEEYDGEMMEVCPLNWGQEPSDYIETFKAVLNAVRAEGIHFAVNRMLAAWESGFVNDTPAQAYDITGGFLTAMEFLPNASPEELTSDYHAEVRSAIAKQLRADANKGGSDD